jgi:hypothetical protein
MLLLPCEHWPSGRLARVAAENVEKAIGRKSGIPVRKTLANQSSRTFHDRRDTRPFNPYSDFCELPARFDIH